ncbi:5,6-dimethylbenzimidazole synthase [Litoreibacter janthinus]|uniref:Cob(II)yrinic acid a,c-diamide reductase n=1 Tax=Litoreibacter janthinus TaxID=670154 RepID=A0A1I6HXD6_9RHOB|nr:5,6-dimethylbenzimidazole synthase [Litoreibacter janthinus]SFR59069.1 cob(II)yrinic acid a,c-diamide reductase [Litoreibacter janthinus]
MRNFEPEFRDELYELMRWRRDVRRFRTTPVDEALLMRCLDAFSHAPSVGLSEPWRIVRVESTKARAAARANFERANADALARYDGDQADNYAKLKLAGMDRSPVQLAIFCDEASPKGHGLGAGTMPEMRRYSVVSAVTLFWLAARAEGLGLGWVSVLDPVQLCRDLGVSEEWALIGYFCLGHPEEDHDTPELLREGWEARAPTLDITRA